MPCDTVVTDCDSKPKYHSVVILLEWPRARRKAYMLVAIVPKIRKMRLQTSVELRRGL